VNNGSVLSVGVVAGFLLVVVSLSFPPPARAAWVNSTGTQFQVGGQLAAITPNNVGTLFVDPSCGLEGGTSLAIVQGLKLDGVDPLLHPVALVVSCLDSVNIEERAQLNFISPADGKVIRQFSTTVVPSNGWAHLVHRQDKGDLLGCGNNSALYSIDFSVTTTTVPDGTATQLVSPAFASCTGLTWDADADMIYVFNQK
jgi:hypothetical protein